MYAKSGALRILRQSKDGQAAKAAQTGPRVCWACGILRGIRWLWGLLDLFEAWFGCGNSRPVEEDERFKKNRKEKSARAYIAVALLKD